MKKTLLILVFLVVILAFTGCMAGTEQYNKDYQAGFFSGIWHGWIAPLALIISFFTDDVRLYETNNVGFWYDLGFYIAIISGFGGVGFLRRKKK